jgi:hypothetical protein
MANDLNAALFRPHVGTRFRVIDNHGATAELELTEVDEVSCDACLEQFTLIFQGAGTPTPLDGMYRFEHASLAALTLFISPAADADAQRTVYQACFSLRRDGAKSAT